MGPSRHELRGDLDLGSRRVPLHLLDEFEIGPNEQPRAVEIEFACAACGGVHRNAAATVFDSIDDDRVAAREYTLCAKIMAPCDRCGTPMGLELAFDVTEYRMRPRATLSVRVAWVKNALGSTPK